MSQKLYVILLSTFCVGGLQAMAPVPVAAMPNAAVASGLSRFLPQYAQKPKTSQVAVPQVQLSDQMLRDIALIAEMENQALDIAPRMSKQKPRVVGYGGFRGLGAPTRVLYQQARPGAHPTKDQVYQETKRALQGLSGKNKDKALKSLRAKYHPDRGFDTELTHAILKAEEELFTGATSGFSQQQSQQSHSVSWQPWVMDRFFMKSAYTNLGQGRVQELLQPNAYKDILEDLMVRFMPERELFYELREKFYQDTKKLIEGHFELINAARPDSSKFESYNIHRSFGEEEAFKKANEETKKILLELYPHLKSQINNHFYQIEKLMKFNEALNGTGQLGRVSFGVNTAGRMKSVLWDDRVYKLTVRVRIFMKWILILTGYGMYKAGSKMYRYLTTPAQPVADEHNFEDPTSHPAQNDVMIEEIEAALQQVQNPVQIASGEQNPFEPVSSTPRYGLKRNKRLFVEPEEELFMPA